MLRKIRLTLAVLFFVAVTALFLDFTGAVHAWLGWTAKVQFLPALLAMNVGVVVLLILLTLLFGRVYCSVICPLGVFQDIVSWISGRRKKKKYRFSYSPEKKWLRYGMLVLFVIAMIAGVGSFVALLAPYSSYGRIASNLFAPVYRWGNNLFAYLAARADSYAFYGTEVWMKSLPTFVIAAVTFVVIVVLAWRNGRTYCNTVCPECTRCSDVCPAGAIRPITVEEKSSTRIGHAVWVRKNCIPLTDGVECGNCARHCPSGAILMVPSDRDDMNSVRIPAVNTERCIGCGACENLCPARPFSAIYVEVHPVHSIM